MKARTARKQLIDGLPIDPRSVGRRTAMHCTCSCWMCTKVGNEESLRTIASDLLKLHAE